MKNSIINKLLPLLILSACGGGGGGGSSYGGGDDGYNPNNPPVIDGSTTSYSVIENQTSAFTVSATDAGDSQHVHEFKEYPGITFYMPAGQGYHGQTNSSGELSFKTKSHY